MTDAEEAADRRLWHVALAYAITGDRDDALGDQRAPDVAALARQLLARRGRSAIAAHRDETLRAGDIWPHPVPADVMAGLSYAQFAAALTQLVHGLGLDDNGEVWREASASSVTPELRRLLDEVPPHHGT